MVAQTGVLDLEDFVEDWAWGMLNKTKSDDDRKIKKREHVKMEINWEKVKFQHDETEYHCEDKKPKKLQAHVVFSTVFVNNTNAEHEYSLGTEKTTKSSCEVQMSKGVSKGVALGLALKTPCEVFETNAGFSREVNFTKSKGEMIENELTWSVDSSIKVPPQTETRASLVVDQWEFDSKFTVKSRFWGRVRVAMYNLKDNNNFVRMVEGDVDEIFRGKEGFTVDKKKVEYTSEGNCHFRYGAEQKVDLNQQPLNNN